MKIKIGISGLGLIGGSILKKLYKTNKYELFCHSASSYEKAAKFVASSNDINILKDCDVVFVCSSVSKTLETLEKLNGFLDKNTVVADVCSIKKELLNKNYNFNFILTHPMAGSEKTGFNASDETLFEDNKWLVDKNNQNEILNSIIDDLGAIKTPVDMQTHDFLCAQISHFPAILSVLLFDSAEDNAKKIASSGFRDMTRLVMGSSDMTLNMFNLNRQNILKCFEILTDKLNNLKNMTDDEKIKLFEEIKQKRAKMYDSCGKNIFQI